MTIEIEQGWQNYAEQEAREELREAVAEFMPTTDLVVYPPDLVFKCEYGGRLLFQEYTSDNQPFGEWVTGDDALGTGVLSGSEEFFYGIQHMIDHVGVAYIYKLYHEQGVPWRGSNVMTAAPWGDANYAPSQKWFFSYAGLSSVSGEGWGWRFSPGTEKELGIDEEKTKPVIYYPFSKSEAPTYEEYVIEDHARAESGDISGPWLTQDIELAMRFIQRCRDEGVVAVCNEFEKTETEALTDRETLYETLIEIPVSVPTYRTTDFLTWTLEETFYLTFTETINSNGTTSDIPYEVVTLETTDFTTWRLTEFGYYFSTFIDTLLFTVTTEVETEIETIVPPSGFNSDRFLSVITTASGEPPE